MRDASKTIHELLANLASGGIWAASTSAMYLQLLWTDGLSCLFSNHFPIPRLKLVYKAW